MSTQVVCPTSSSVRHIKPISVTRSRKSIILHEGTWIQSDRDYLPAFSREDHAAAIALMLIADAPVPPAVARHTVQQEQDATSNMADVVPEPTASAVSLGSAGSKVTHSNKGKARATRSPSSTSSGLSRKASHRGPGKEAREKQAAIREQWKARAKAIETPRGTQANDFHLFVMNWVRNEVTPYPDDAWAALVAIAIDRSFVQVKHWFSNQRQVAARKGTSRLEDVETVTVDDRSFRLWRKAVESSGPWSDEHFETALQKVVRGQQAKYEAQLAAIEWQATEDIYIVYIAMRRFIGLYVQDKVRKNPRYKTVVYTTSHEPKLSLPESQYNNQSETTQGGPKASAESNLAAGGRFNTDVLDDDEGEDEEDEEVDKYDEVDNDKDEETSDVEDVDVDEDELIEDKRVDEDDGEGKDDAFDVDEDEDVDKVRDKVDVADKDVAVLMASPAFAIDWNAWKV
ncbi:predicted protein [Postia placenta Mad-698-R]|nr:predicted protein [Postia placenta Mad-698-R]